MTKRNWKVLAIYLAAAMVYTHPLRMALAPFFTEFVAFAVQTGVDLIVIGLITLLVREEEVKH